jgi:hypothetical protein
MLIYQLPKLLNLFVHKNIEYVYSIQQHIYTRQSPHPHNKPLTLVYPHPETSIPSKELPCLLQASAVKPHKPPVHEGMITSNNIRLRDVISFDV